MTKASFTRDEVILALDVLYFSGEEHLTAKKPPMQELSELLRRLPIHQFDADDTSFRNASGIARQIMLFNQGKQTGTKSTDVGNHFFEIDAEFEDHREDLHSIATAIRRNEKFYKRSEFGNSAEVQGFPEGALLGHLHRVVERRDSAKLTPEKRCEICQIDTTEIYPGCHSLMAMHLTVPITALDGKKRYSASEFITVCPNCHAALHQRRPWLAKENCGELLR